MTARQLPVSLAVAALLAVAVPAAASASTMNVDGTGVAAFRTAKTAQVIGVTVRPPGRVRLTAADAASFRPRCIRKSRKRCVRRDPRTGAWIVLRPVKFIYDGERFSLRVQSRTGFEISLSGVGVLKLNGTGTYTRDGATVPYDGDIPPIRLTGRHAPAG